MTDKEIRIKEYLFASGSERSALDMAVSRIMDIEKGASSTVDSTLDARGLRYGLFKDHADISQGLKGVLHAAPKFEELDADMKEALEMIAHKIGRILNGDPSYTDSWHDIAGYAKLIENRLNGVVK